MEDGSPGVACLPEAWFHLCLSSSSCLCITTESQCSHATCTHGVFLQASGIVPELIVVLSVSRSVLILEHCFALDEHCECKRGEIKSYSCTCLNSKSSFHAVKYLLDLHSAIPYSRFRQLHNLLNTLPQSVSSRIQLNRPNPIRSYLATTTTALPSYHTSLWLRNTSDHSLINRIRHRNRPRQRRRAYGLFLPITARITARCSEHTRSRSRSRRRIIREQPLLDHRRTIRDPRRSRERRNIYHGRVRICAVCYYYWLFHNQVSVLFFHTQRTAREKERNCRNSRQNKKQVSSR